MKGNSDAFIWSDELCPACFCLFQLFQISVAQIHVYGSYFQDYSAFVVLQGT